MKAKAPAKRSQHANTTCRNIVRRSMLRGVVKFEPTAPNNVAPCCVGMLRSFGRGLRIIWRTRSQFSFCKQLWNIPIPLWFSRNPLRELNGQNIFTWTTLCLQRVKIEIRRGLKRKLVLAKTRFVWTIRFSDQLLARSPVEIWQLIRRQQTTNHKYCFSTNQRKNQNLVFEHMIRQVNVSFLPSQHLNTGKEGMIAG